MFSVIAPCECWSNRSASTSPRSFVTTVAEPGLTSFCTSMPPPPPPPPPPAAAAAAAAADDDDDASRVFLYRSQHDRILLAAWKVASTASVVAGPTGSAPSSSPRARRTCA